MAVGIFDSGLGGLTVYKEVAALMPDLPIVYYGDNAKTPYGVRDADEIYELTCAGTERLFDAGCDLVILACNTASAAAWPPLSCGTSQPNQPPCVPQQRDWSHSASPSNPVGVGTSWKVTRVLRAVRRTQPTGLEPRT